MKLSWQIQHLILGYYCGTFVGKSYWWPSSGVRLPIFEFKKEEAAQGIVDVWVNTFGNDRGLILVQEYNYELNEKILINPPPIMGNC